MCLHGLGKAIPKTISVALEVQRRSYGQIVAAPMTSTVPLVDDFIPLIPVRYNNLKHVPSCLLTFILTTGASTA